MRTSIYKLQVIRAKILSLFFYRFFFKNFGRSVLIFNPTAIVNSRYISIGDNVVIRDHARIEAIDTLREPSLIIGNNCNIEQNVHIVCSGAIMIGDNCSITARCSIVDTYHPFNNIGSRKIGARINDQAARVEISEGCFIGIGAVILHDVFLGRRCVIGANAVVLPGIYPDGSILAGVPARIIRTIQISDSVEMRNPQNE